MIFTNFDSSFGSWKSDFDSENLYFSIAPISELISIKSFLENPF